jgi:NarL family two-component system sensor histidine kinase LiaS
LEWSAPHLVITVADDGVGFDLKKKSTSRNGLGNQAARMEEIGGQFQIVSEPGRGTKVEFRIRLETAGR